MIYIYTDSADSNSGEEVSHRFSLQLLVMHMCMENEVVYKNEYLSLMMIDKHVCGKELILCTDHQNEPLTSSAITRCRKNNKSVIRSYIYIYVVW